VRRGIRDRRASTTLNPEVSITNAAGDNFFPELFFERERLVESFEILPDIVIPPGDYRWQRAYLGVESSQNRALSGGLFGSFGSFYDGHRTDFGAYTTWRPSARFGFNTSFDWNNVDFPAGRFIVRIASLGMDLNPNTRLACNFLVQWDNVSDELGWNARVRWTFAPGRDVYFALNQVRETLRNRATISADATLKLVWNWDW
jgi:hypothetical protein